MSAAPTQSPAPLPDDLKFEDALERLEEIVDEMETGDLALDDCLQHFETGMQLSKFCAERLKQTERKVEILMKNANADDAWQTFEGDDADDDEA